MYQILISGVEAIDFLKPKPTIQNCLSEGVNVKVLPGRLDLQLRSKSTLQLVTRLRLPASRPFVTTTMAKLVWGLTVSEGTLFSLAMSVIPDLVMPLLRVPDHDRYWIRVSTELLDPEPNFENGSGSGSRDQNLEKRHVSYQIFSFLLMS